MIMFTITVITIIVATIINALRDDLVRAGPGHVHEDAGLIVYWTTL